MTREEWFKALIREFRDRYNQLSENEKKHISNLDDLTEPCQILSVTFDHPSATYTFIVHLSNVNDGKVWAYGPIKPYEALYLFERIVNDPVWDVPINNDKLLFLEELENPTVRDILDSELMRILRGIQAQIFIPPPSSYPSGFSKHYLMERSAVWYYNGDIVQNSPAKLVEEIIKDAKRAYKEQKRREREASTKDEPIKVPPSSKVEYPWYGTYLFSPITFGKEPRTPFSERLFGVSHIFKLGTVVFEGKLKGRNFIATHNGFIGIEDEKSSVLEMLNMLSAVLLLKGTPCYVIREHEVGGFRYDIASKEFGGWSMPVTPRFLIRTDPTQRTSIPYRKRKLTPEQLNQALRDTERYMDNHQIRFYLPFFLESHTHLRESEYSQSFFMSWVIIETYLRGKWKEVLQDKDISRKRRKKLENPGAWSIDYLIETMNISGVLTNTDYKDLMELKKKRNDIIHGTSKASKKDSGKALSVALNIVKQEISRIN